MAIMMGCPTCRRKQRVRNKTCPCGEDMDRMKQRKKVKYWIVFQVAKKQKWECVGLSYDDARARERERLVQREKNPATLTIDRKMTFSQLAEWYMQLKSVQALSSHRQISVYVRKFLMEFGNRTVTSLKPADLEDLQIKRKEQGYAPASIDQEVAHAQIMVNKAFMNDLVDIGAISVFKRVRKVLKANGNARDRILSPEEFVALCDHAPKHLRDILVMGYYTGMRLGEILPLTWEKVDMKARVIRLEATDTKDREKRAIPICEALYHVLKAIPRSIDPSCRVFTYMGHGLSDIHTGLRRACKAAGIVYGREAKDGFVFHDLRHTFNTNMRRAGVADSVIMSITGHSTRAMFDRYNTIDQGDKDHAISSLSLYLSRLNHGLDQVPTKPHG